MGPVALYIEIPSHKLQVHLLIKTTLAFYYHFVHCTLKGFLDVDWPLLFAFDIFEIRNMPTTNILDSLA